MLQSTAEVSKRNRTTSGARLIAEMLHAYGVDHVFFMDAVLRRTLAECGTLGIRRILAHTEKGAAYMADGYARASHRVAVLMAQSVGAANLAAGLQDARLYGAPIVALTGRHVAANQYRNAYQELPHEAMFASFVKTSLRIDSPEQLPHVLRQAFREASSSPPRPVHIDAAGNTGNVTDFWELERDEIVEPAYAHFPPQRNPADAKRIEQVAAAIRRAERPVIIAGAGAIMAQADAAIRSLADKAQIPVLATLDAKAVMVDSDELFGGIVGTYSCHCANKLLAEADFVLFIGCEAGDQATNNFKLPLANTALVQIDSDPTELGRNFAGCIGIHADPQRAVEQLVDAVSRQRRPAWVARLRALVAEWKEYIAPLMASESTPIRPERLCQLLGEWLPEDAIVVADTGYSSQWSGTMMPLNSPHQLYLRAAGSLGWAFPAALGAKCAHPNRPVVCFTGDGGMMYHLAELETAKRYDIPTVTIVNNNSRLGQGFRNATTAHKGIPGRMEDLFTFTPTNFAALAEAFGCVGIRVEKPGELPAAFARALEANKPAVIDVVTDPSALCDLPWSPT